MESAQKRDGRAAAAAVFGAGLPAGDQVCLCVAGSSAHDEAEKEWRHLGFWQHRTNLRARVPRLQCEEHGMLQAEAP